MSFKTTLKYQKPLELFHNVLGGTTFTISVVINLFSSVRMRNMLNQLEYYEFSLKYTPKRKRLM